MAARLRAGPAAFNTVALESGGSSRMWVLLQPGEAPPPPAGNSSTAALLARRSAATAGAGGNATAALKAAARRMDRDERDQWKRFMFHVNRVTLARVTAAEEVEAGGGAAAGQEAKK